MTTSRSIEFDAIEFGSARDAIDYAEAGATRAVLLDGKHYVMQKREADRLAEAGVAFAYLFDRDLADGRNVVVSVPVN